MIKGKNAGKDFGKKPIGSRGGEINPTENLGKESRTFCSDFGSVLQSLQLQVQLVQGEENGHFST